MSVQKLTKGILRFGGSACKNHSRFNDIAQHYQQKKNKKAKVETTHGLHAVEINERCGDP